MTLPNPKPHENRREKGIDRKVPSPSFSPLPFKTHSSLNPNPTFDKHRQMTLRPHQLDPLLRVLPTRCHGRDDATTPAAAEGNGGP